jgi:hypothetical protein
VDEQFLSGAPDYFFPSLFQECIEKDYEIRIFYLDGEFFSVALLVTGQGGAVDIKQGSAAEDAIWVPYKLPTDFSDQQRAVSTYFWKLTRSGSMARRRIMGTSTLKKELPNI